MLPNLFQTRLSALQSADDLRSLFADLSYEANFDSLFLPRATKADEAAQECLAGDIEVLARHGKFEIIYAPLSDWKRAHSAQRLLISRLLENHRFALWVFSDAKGENWHLVNVKTGAGKGKAAMSRHVLRRFSFAQGENAGRTSVERLLQIDLANFIGTELEVQERHNLAFDVEAVTRDFFRDYRLVFEDVEGRVKVAAGIEKRAWTQRLFNRLMFLRFLERKGWLEYNGDKEYLRALFSASVKAKENDFLNDRLFYAFFWGLGFVSDQTELHTDEWLEEKRGKVPYLNGGLFEQIGDGDVQGRVSLPNAAFTAILGLFDKYNFTVTESTPFDQEVGIDPEMLGKVFEELVTGRHESGSYYTPRGIVSFMGREVLKGYLEGFDTPVAVSKLVDDGDGTAVSDPERILAALREVTICDPACGSGAYLLGMMQELLRLREALFAAKSKDHRKIYDRKLEIIASNLYGVDKDPFAVGIAMLRLWLSLIIEFEGAVPPPLPNLKYKIESGDSLAAPLGGQKTLDSDTVHAFNEKKQQYVKSHHEEKQTLEKEIEILRAELKAWSTAPPDAFDWRTEFAEIFSPPENATTVFGTLNLGVQLPTVGEAGFDIVLANPPYIRNGLIVEQKPQLKAIFGDNFSGSADLYCFFYLRGHELLKDGGLLAFISPHKWILAAYGSKLRAHFAAKSYVRSIIHFGDLPIFQAATAYPMIFISEKRQFEGVTTFTEVKSLDDPYPDVRALVLNDGIPLPSTALDGSTWNLSGVSTSSRLRITSKNGVPLGDYVKGQIFRGVLTGFNEAFVIDGETRDALIRKDKNSAELIKPLIAGRDTLRWSVNYKDKWLIFARRGTEIKDFPAIEAHLKQWKSQLTPKTDGAIVGRKPGRYKWFEIQDEIAYYKAFAKPKIIFPDLAVAPRFSFDGTGSFTNDTTFILTMDDLYLLGVLNSTTFESRFREVSPIARGGYLRFKRVYLEPLLIPIPSKTDRTAIEELVAECLNKRGQDCQPEEAEINAIVAKLYGL